MATWSLHTEIFYRPDQAFHPWLCLIEAPIETFYRPTQVPLYGYMVHLHKNIYRPIQASCCRYNVQSCWDSDCGYIMHSHKDIFQVYQTFGRGYVIRSHSDISQVYPGLWLCLLGPHRGMFYRPIYAFGCGYMDPLHRDILQAYLGSGCGYMEPSRRDIFKA